MNPECEKVLNSTAGRKLSQAEIDGIDERMHGALRELSLKDHAKFMGMSEMDRHTAAAQLAKQHMVDDMQRAHEQTLLEASRKASLFADTDAVTPGLKGQVHSLKNKVVNVETRTDAIAAAFGTKLNGLHEADGGKLFGTLQDPAKQRELAGALFGEQASPAVKRAAESIKATMDEAAARYQRAGLTLHPNENWRLPQPQDPMRVASNHSQWVEDHMNWVDRRAYVRPDGRLINDNEMRRMLGESWKSIATDGANKRAEGIGQAGTPGGVVGARRNAPRQLYFKDADAYTAAMNKYGSTNFYDLIGGHLRGMSKEIAVAETFGRNADKNFTQALARAYVNDQGALGTDGERGKLASLQNKTQSIYDAYAHPQRPGNEAWANAGVQFRSLVASTQLGGFVGALPDLAGMKLMAEHAGLPQIRMFGNFLSSMFSGAEKKEFLSKLGVWQEGFQHAQNRYGEETFKSGFGTFLNELTHKMSGLNAFDRGLRGGIGRTVMHTIGQFTRDHETLAGAEGEARLLQDHGINESHWATWRKAELDAGPHGNESLLTPQNIYDIKDPSVTPEMKDAAAEKLLEAAYGQMQFGARGASRASVADRVAMGTTSAPAGTISGELLRFLLQFKSVPIGILRAHWQRLSDLPTFGSKAAYGAKFLAYTTLMGAITTQSRAVINGQNPRSMNIMTPEGRKFWLESTLAGGALGLYGDILGHGKSAYGTGAEALAGPAFTALYDVAKEVGQGIDDAQTGESKHPYLLSATRWIRKNATPLSNLWYAKAAFNRLVYDGLQDTLSPGSSDKQKQRMESRGASYWWAPGTSSPQSAPDLGKAVE
jgi:hypothetical protein